jgi:hypothetical protein
LLVLYQLDLIAQLEFQLRCVHQTMRHIEKLRSAQGRVGPELSDGQRGNTLARLSDDIAEVDRQLDTSGSPAKTCSASSSRCARGSSAS